MTASVGAVPSRRMGPERYVAILDLPNARRMFCSDQYRQEWSFTFGFAELFLELHEAAKVADRHGGRVSTWAEAAQFERIPA